MALKPDGLFLAAIFGGETLKELRIACTIAHMECEGGVSPRISPLAQVRDAGKLFTSAGFTLPGVDVDEYQVVIDDVEKLMEIIKQPARENAMLIYTLADENMDASVRHAFKRWGVPSTDILNSITEEILVDQVLKIQV